MMNTEEIHGHAVFEMMIASGKSYSRESLRQAIDEKFGKDARFHICTGSGFTADELIVELSKKGKFVGTEEAFTFDTTRMCNH